MEQRRSVLEAKVGFVGERALDDMSQAFKERRYREAFNLATDIIGPEDALPSLLMKPYNWDALYRAFTCRAQIYERQVRNYQKALEDYDYALGIKQHPDLFNNRGNVKRLLGNFSGALEDYENAIRLTPDDAELYYNKGTLLDDLSSFDLAIESFNKAIELLPDQGRYYNNRGYVFQNLKRYDDAIRDYDKVIGNLLFDLCAAAYVHYVIRKRQHLFFQKALSATKSDIWITAMVNKSHSLKFQEKYEESIRAIEELMTAVPSEQTNPFFLRDMATCYKLQGKNKQALEKFEEALEQNRNDFDEEDLEAVQQDIQLLLELMSALSPSQ
eukprot:TRINITY_DN3905_c0_g1_i4.p1 TRINITY_DN3905_c0_g1~~TRINITY_DN3905_c0_g1_i4.p1  ORF type:complete len:328 (+),score=83.67 TRINITY_DN3905_c0_g1_i4:44-1027(+)